jgi:sugar/nucleoside kinase (ribokinase family)
MHSNVVKHEARAFAMMSVPMPRFDVTITGELNLDLILYGLPEELPPERELLAERMMLTLGGSSTIVAHNLAALRRRVGFVSLVGNDPLGQIALGLLKSSGVDISRVQTSGTGLQTGLTVVLQREEWRNMVTYAGTIAELRYQDLDFEYLADSKHFHFSSYFLQRNLQPGIAELFKRLKAAGLTTSLDTNDDPDDSWQGLDSLLPYVDVLLPNEREARKIAADDDLEKAIKRLSEMVPLVVVKLGENGSLAQHGNKRFKSPAVPVVAIDAVGAGDSFNAGFLSQYVLGADLPACLRAGNLAGALSTTRPGGVEAFREREYREQFLRTRDVSLK